MLRAVTEPVFIVSSRYADEVAAVSTDIGAVPCIERRPERAAERFAAESARLVVIDARGALPQGLAAARSLDAAVKKRHGAMLVLLSRADGIEAVAAHDAGATSVLVSPFGSATFGDALRLAARHAGRLSEAAAALQVAGGDAPASQPPADRMTGLATGDQLQVWITAALQGADTAPPVFLLAVGIARFSQINAAYGRAVADRVLAAVAQRLDRSVGARAPGGDMAENRMLARLAAAEFAVGVTGSVSLAAARLLAETLANAFETPFLIDSHVIHLSARIGIAIGDAGGVTDAAAVIRQASSALLLARGGEAGTIEIFKRDPAGDPLTRLADLESDLHRAIEGDNIAILFQPQMALGSGQIIGVEALVRWEHPTLGLLSAETLLGTAATAELAIKLGRHIRSRAMREAVGWVGPASRLRLSVNVTAADLADPGFANALEAARVAARLPRNRLTLEVTEGALITDIYGAVALLVGLRADGIKIALDDFGTGYSSLAWMARLPIDVIKLDRSFTLGLTGSPRERVVVETMVRLSKQLGMTVIAEGVEDDVQLEAARLAGCDAVQGFRVAAPMAAEPIQNFCDRWQRRSGDE